MARPSAFTQELADQICDALTDGCSLRSICKLDGMPSTTTVMRWLRERELFRAQYARAREDQADYLAEETIDIADEASDGESAQVARVRIDARKWFASKVAPRKYGDKMELEHSGDLVVNLTFGKRKDQRHG